MAKMRLEFDGFDDILRKLSNLDADTKNIAENALRKTHELVTDKAERGMDDTNLPAKGQYSTGDTLQSLKRNADIEWNGAIGSVPVGFDIKRGGLVSIFLMYGTPKMKKDQALYNAFKSAKTKKEVVEVQEEVFYGAIRELEE